MGPESHTYIHYWLGNGFAQLTSEYHKTAAEMFPFVGGEVSGEGGEEESGLTRHFKKQHKYSVNTQYTIYTPVSQQILQNLTS